MAGDRAVVAAGAARSHGGLAVAQLGDERRHRLVVRAGLRAPGIETAPQDGHRPKDRPELVPPRPRQRAMLRLLAAIALAAIVGACGPIVAPATPQPAGPQPSVTVPPLVTIETRGGLCFDGECRSVVSIEGDGRLHQIAPRNAELGRVPPALVGALRAEIDRANWPLLRSRPFRDTCPTAYDGQETIYSFTHTQGTAFERIGSCEVVIDPHHPLFVAVAAALAAAGR